MSTTQIYNGNYDPYSQYPGSPSDGYNRDLIREEFHNLRRRQQTAAWYNPAAKGQDYRMDGLRIREDTIFVGEDGMIPTWDDPALDMSVYRRNQMLLRQGKIDEDKALYNHWLGDWENSANEYYSTLDSNGIQTRSASGVIDSSDNVAVKVVNILAEVLGRDTRQYTMESAVDRIATPNLTATIDTWKGFTVSQNVGEGVKALPKKGSFTRASYEMTKNVGYIAATDESQLRADKDIMQFHIQQVGQGMRQAKATAIATALETAGDTAGSDWAAYTGEHSTANPFDQIGALMRTIVANGGNPDSIASSSRPYQDFLSNSWANGVGNPSQNAQYNNAIVTNIGGLPGVTWYIDELKTATLVTVYDRMAVKLFQGPVRTAQFRSEVEGIDCYITRDWFTCQVVDSSRVKDLTGISA